MPTRSRPRLAARSVALLTVGVEMLVAVIPQTQCLPRFSSPGWRERSEAPSWLEERRERGTGGSRSLGGDELIPFADQVVILVHDRVPAGDVAHAVVVGAAVACGARLFEQRAIRSSHS